MVFEITDAANHSILTEGNDHCRFKQVRKDEKRPYLKHMKQFFFA